MSAWKGIGWMLILWGVCISCIEYTPKPRGYFRIEPPIPVYQSLPDLDLPYTFQISTFSEVELPPVGDFQGWINVSYPQLKAKLYCSYFPITAKRFVEVDDETRRLVVRQTKNPNQITVQAYHNPEAKVYGSLFMLGDAATSPIQFMLTDSSSHYFRGALYYDCIVNPDSLAPVTHYLKQDIIYLIQSFTWRE